MVQELVNLCISKLGYRSVSDDELNSTIQFISPVYPTVNVHEAKKMLAQHYNINVAPYKVLVDMERRKPWYKVFKANNPDTIDNGFWQRYKTYLLSEKHFAPDVVKSTDTLTDDIMDYLFDPNLRKIEIDKKGLVVGHVQSGKTMNFTSLICKASDAGFNLIIILAGIHNNLRSQTQTRLDEEFLGFDTQYKRVYDTNGEFTIGVGKIGGYPNTVASSLTTSEQKGDFTAQKANGGIAFNTNDTLIMVVKKNSSILKRVKNWLETKTDSNDKIEIKSLLVIDDEADHASINTKKDSETPTAINRLIREIMSLFYRRAYVGYTATPFANIFINCDNTDDLFPRDFIVSLPAPSNYIGPDKIFGTSVELSDNDDLLPICRKITDFQDFFPDKQKMDGQLPHSLPESLITAIQSFIITCAIRTLRGQEYKHNSMLVHVTRYKGWQNNVKELVESEFNYIKNGVIQKNKTIIEQLRKIFEEDTPENKSFKTTSREILESSFADIDTEIKVHEWEDVRPLLRKVVERIETMAINGDSKDALKYYENKDKGLYVIAIGGDKLSRGLTLEGLSVSYYLRASKMYDTLMQMGRWFGYRPGYVDLCRLFTSPELNKWFCHITLANDELRAEFDALARANATPDSYALKVRTAPEQLQITAVSKMRNADTIQLSWAGRLVETYQLPLDKNVIHRNLISTQNFLESLGAPSPIDKRNYLRSKEGEYLWSNVSPDDICDFFSKFKVADDLKKVNLTLILNYIKKLNSSFGELSSWRVSLKSVKNENDKYFELANGIKAGCSFRNADSKDSVDTYYIRKNHIVSSATDELVDIEDDILKIALSETKRDEPSWDEFYPSPKLVRTKYRPCYNPLLIIYPLDPIGANTWSDKKRTKLLIDRGFTENDDPIIGFAIVFPMSNNMNNAVIEYAINNSLIEEFIESENYYNQSTDADDYYND
ncbi:MAG: endonuclease [Porphyromonadaceae bacterium CG2_30_38_12]|nr:MAG: endonuclease [Porphyromonadaceae bacterium CG2_30_38_12]